MNGVAFLSRGPRLLLASCSDDTRALIWDVSKLSIALKVAQARGARVPAVEPPAPTIGMTSVGDPADMAGVD